MSLYDWGESHHPRDHPRDSRDPRPPRSPLRSPSTPTLDYNSASPVYMHSRPEYQDTGKLQLETGSAGGGHHRRHRSTSKSGSRDPSPNAYSYPPGPYSAGGLPYGASAGGGGFPYSAGGGALPSPPPHPSPWHSSAPYSPPARQPPLQKPIICDGCGTDVNDRPRVHCLQCTEYDLCSLCYTDRKTSASHELWHKQQTLLPGRPMMQKVGNPRALHACDVCRDDLTGKDRISCADCTKYELCLDCNLAGATNGPHERSHKVYKVPAAQTIALMGDDGNPSDLYVRLLDDIFDYVDANFRPRDTGVMEPEKLSAFYRKMGMNDEDNIGLFSDDKIAFQYASMRCQYILISNKHSEISARATAWTIDALDTVPRTPALTRTGWIRFLVVCTWRAPSLMHFMVRGALETGAVREKDMKEENTYYRWLKVSREAFPRTPLNLGQVAIKA